MTGRQAMRRYFISLLLLLMGTSLAAAQPFTRRSSQEKHDGLKQDYEIANFRLGGKYDLNDPAKWENGGEGVVDFVTRGAVDTSSPLGTDRMIKGAVASAMPVAPTPPGAAPTAGLNK